MKDLLGGKIIHDPSEDFEEMDRSVEDTKDAHSEEDGKPAVDNKESDENDDSSADDSTQNTDDSDSSSESDENSTDSEETNEESTDDEDSGEEFIISDEQEETIVASVGASFNEEFEDNINLEGVTTMEGLRASMRRAYADEVARPGSDLREEIKQEMMQEEGLTKDTLSYAKSMYYGVDMNEINKHKKLVESLNVDFSKTTHDVNLALLARANELDGISPEKSLKMAKVDVADFMEEGKVIDQVGYQTFLDKNKEKVLKHSRNQIKSLTSTYNKKKKEVVESARKDREQIDIIISSGKVGDRKISGARAKQLRAAVLNRTETTDDPTEKLTLFSKRMREMNMDEFLSLAYDVVFKDSVEDEKEDKKKREKRGNWRKKMNKKKDRVQFQAEKREKESAKGEWEEAHRN